MSKPAPGQKITRADLEGKIRNLQGGATERAEDAKASLVQVGAGLGLVLMLLVFLLGQRRGKRKSTIVEIRRF
jgi:hypothetical protein